MHTTCFLIVYSKYVCIYVHILEQPIDRAESIETLLGKLSIFAVPSTCHVLEAKKTGNGPKTDNIHKTVQATTRA